MASTLFDRPERVIHNADNDIRLALAR